MILKDVPVGSMCDKRAVMRVMSLDVEDINIEGEVAPLRSENHGLSIDGCCLESEVDVLEEWTRLRVKDPLVCEPLG